MYLKRKQIDIISDTKKHEPFSVNYNFAAEQRMIN